MGKKTNSDVLNYCIEKKRPQEEYHACLKSLVSYLKTEEVNSFIIYIKKAMHNRYDAFIEDALHLAQSGSAPLRNFLNSDEGKVALTLAAIEYKHPLFDQWLKDVQNPKHKQSLLFRHAIQCENDDAIEQLWPVSDLDAERCYALTRMASVGNVKWVTRLIPVSDPNIDDATALRSALLRFTEKTHGVKDPTQSEFLKKHPKGDYERVISALIPVTDMDMCVQFLRRSLKIQEEHSARNRVKIFQSAICYLESHELNRQLTEHLKSKGVSENTIKRKI